MFGTAYLTKLVMITNERCPMRGKTLITYYIVYLVKALNPVWTDPTHVASPVAQMVKNLPAMQETLVQSLGQEDPLEKGISTYSSILAWKIPWTEPGGLQSLGLQRVGHDWVTNSLFQHILYILFVYKENILHFSLKMWYIRFTDSQTLIDIKVIWCVC